MNFDLTDEQQMLQAAAREFLAARLKSEQIRELGRVRRRLRRGPLARDERPELARPDGVGGLRRPGARHGRAGRADGAARLRARARADPLEHAGRASRSRRRPPTSRRSATWRRWRPASSAARWRCGTRGAGWTPDDITLEPEQSNGGYVLNGEKLFVLDAATRRLLHRRRDRRPAVHRRARRRRRLDRADADDRRDPQAVRGQARRREGRRGRRVRRRRRDGACARCAPTSRSRPSSPGSRSARSRWRSSTPRSASSSAGRSAPTRRCRTAARRCCSRPRARARPPTTRPGPPTTSPRRRRSRPRWRRPTPPTRARA